MLQNCFIKRVPSLLAQGQIRYKHSGVIDPVKLRPLMSEQVSDKLILAIRRRRVPTVWKSYVDLKNLGKISLLPAQYHSMAIQSFDIKDSHHYNYQYLKQHKRCVEQIIQIAKENNYKLDLRDYNMILRICYRMRDWQSATQYWNQMTTKNEESYNLYMKVALSARQNEQVFKIFDELQASNARPNAETYNNLIKANGRMKNITEADRLFKEHFTTPKEKTNFITQWFKKSNTSVYTPLSAPLFRRVATPSDVLSPTIETFEALLSAHSRVKNAPGVHYVHKSLIPYYGITKNVKIYDALIKAYCVCEDMDGAKETFIEMQKENIKPNVHIFDHMFKHEVLKKGRPKVAEDLINYMTKEYNIQPLRSMYTTLIKTHNKHNRIEDADRLMALLTAMDAKHTNK